MILFDSLPQHPATHPGAAAVAAHAPASSPPPPAYPALAGVAAPAWGNPAAGPQPTGVSLQVEIELGQGYTTRAFMHFGPEHAHPQALAAIAIELANIGLLKPYQKREEGGGFNGGFNAGRNDNNFNRGSYGRRSRW